MTHEERFALAEREIERDAARAIALVDEIREFNERWDREHDERVRAHFADLEAEQRAFLDHVLDGIADCE